MQACSNCQSKQFDGTIFCAECGASMAPTIRRETTMSLGQHGPPGEFAPDPSATSSPEPVPSGPRITLVIMNSGRRINLDIGDDLLIGRKDNARGIFPDVDLGLDGGYDSGVSRRHAILAHQHSVYTIEDLGSSNGTFVNGKRLVPQTATPIESGDELKCGTLLIRVEFGNRP
jgi:pSer/pThr/pTyr-binding forkhead associated (FHA) protein